MPYAVHVVLEEPRRCVAVRWHDIFRDSLVLILPPQEGEIRVQETVCEDVHQPHWDETCQALRKGDPRIVRSLRHQHDRACRVRVSWDAQDSDIERLVFRPPLFERGGISHHVRPVQRRASDSGSAHGPVARDELVTGFRFMSGLDLYGYRVRPVALQPVMRKRYVRRIHHVLHQRGPTVRKVTRKRPGDTESLKEVLWRSRVFRCRCRAPWPEPYDSFAHACGES